MELGYNNGIRYLFIASFILLAIIPPLYYIHGYLSQDESGFMFIGDSINHGSILYKDFIDNKPPGIFYLNAFIFVIFGKSFYASRAVLFIVNALSALIIYFLGKDQWNEHIGQLSSILFLIGIYNPLVEGYFVLTEQFMVFFGLIGIFVFFKFRDWRHLILVGVFLGISTLFKQPGILFYLILAIYSLLGLLNKEDRTKTHTYNTIKSLSLISIGVLVPIFIAAVFFYREGVLYDFFYWSILYYVSGKYGTSFNAVSLLQPIFSLIIIFIPAFICVMIVIYNSISKKVQYNNLLAVYWFLLFGLTLTARQSGHYFVQVLPPACILASIALTKVPLLGNINEVFSKKGLVKIFILISIIVMLYYAVPSAIFYEHLMGSDRNRVLEDQIETSNFIILHTEPNQKIISLPYDPSIYFLSGRSPCVNYLGLGTLLTTGNEQDDLIAHINKSNVPYIVINTKFKGWLTENLYQFIMKNYTKEKKIGIYKVLSHSS